MNNASNTVSSVLAGTDGLTKLGGGELILSGVNTYTGLTTVDAGTLTLALGTAVSGTGGNYVIDNGAVLKTTVTVNVNSRTITFGTNGGSINLGASLRVSNTRFVTTGGPTSYITGSLLDLGTATYDVADGTNAVDLVVGSSINRGGIVKDGGGTLRFTNAANNLQSNPIKINDGVLEIGEAGRLLNGNYAGNITNNAIFAYNSTANQTLGGVISGTGNLIKTNTGTLTLSGANSYSGATTVGAGKLVVNGTNANSAVTVQSGATLGGSGQVGTLSVAGLLAPGNSVGTLAAGSTTFQTNGTLQLELYDWTGSAGSAWDLLAITGDLTLSNTSANPFVIDLVSMSSTNTTGLSTNWNQNANWTNTFVTYSGSQLGETFAANLFTVSTNNFQNTLNGTFTVTNVSGGLALLYITDFDPGASYEWNAGSGDWSTGGNWTNGSAPTNGTLLVFTGPGGTATNDSAVTSVAGVTFSNTTGSITLDGSALSIAEGGIDNKSTNAHTISNNINVTAPMAITASSNNLTIAGNITNDTASQQLTFNGSENTAVSGVISGAGLLAKSGDGTLTLTGANTYSGGTVVNGGVLSGDANGLQGTITNDASVVFDQSADGTYAGVMSGSGTLFKVNTGTLTLTSANTHAGGTSLGYTNGSPAGTVLIQNSAALGTGQLAFEAGGTLDLGVDGLTVTNSVLVANRADTSARTIRLDLAGTNTGVFSSAIDVRDDLGSFVADVGEDDKLTFSASVYTGASGGAGLTKTGAGTLVLSAAATYVGDTTIQQGTLEMNVAGTNNMGSATYLGAGTLSKTGAGTLQWGTGVGTFSLSSGALIDVQEGLFRGGTGANEVWTSNLSDLNVAAGAVFNGVEAEVRVDALSGSGEIRSGFYSTTKFTFGVDNGSGTFAGVLADNTSGTVPTGKFVKEGSGTQVLTGTNTYTGYTVISGGTLEIGGAG